MYYMVDLKHIIKQILLTTFDHQFDYKNMLYKLFIQQNSKQIFKLKVNFI